MAPISFLRESRDREHRLTAIERIVYCIFSAASHEREIKIYHGGHILSDRHIRALRGIDL